MMNKRISQKVAEAHEAEAQRSPMIRLEKYQYQEFKQPRIVVLVGPNLNRTLAEALKESRTSIPIIEMNCCDFTCGEDVILTEKKKPKKQPIKNKYEKKAERRFHHVR